MPPLHLTHLTCDSLLAYLATVVFLIIGGFAADGENEVLVSPGSPPLLSRRHPRAPLAGSAAGGVSDDLVGEMCRCAAGELHAVAAVVGAIAAQEAIKLLTGQFVPVEGALIYNAMACTTSVFAF